MKTDCLKEIGEKLARLAEADKGRKVFGAFLHKYQLNLPLPEQEIKAFEAEHGIELPEEYSLYLSNIANGGAGPFYGLMGLDKNDGNEVDPSKPFPFTKEAPLILMDLKDDDMAQAYQDAENGVIYLAHEGCGMYSILVVNGQERGNVWFLDFANDLGAVPLASPKTGGPMGFFEWFGLWLDASLALVETGAEKLGGYMDHIEKSAVQKLEAAFTRYTDGAEP